MRGGSGPMGPPPAVMYDLLLVYDLLLLLLLLLLLESKHERGLREPNIVKDCASKTQDKTPHPIEILRSLQICPFCPLRMKRLVMYVCPLTVSLHSIQDDHVLLIWTSFPEKLLKCCVDWYIVDMSTLVNIQWVSWVSATGESKFCGHNCKNGIRSPRVVRARTST